jgi:hypothetical protein
MMRWILLLVLACTSNVFAEETLLAIGQSVPMSEMQLRQALKPEVTATVKLYLDGKITQWWLRRDKPGVVFVMQCRSMEEARSLLAELPLVKDKLLSFDLIPVGPLTPLGVLLPNSAEDGKAKPEQK